MNTNTASGITYPTGRGGGGGGGVAQLCVVSRGGRPTLQPLTPQQRWERGTAKWLVLLHSQRLEREAAKSSRYRQLRDMGVELTPKLQRYLWCGPWECQWCQLVWKLRANVSDLRYRASLWGTRVCDNDLGLRSSDRGVCPLCDRGKEDTIHFLLYCSNDRIRHAWSEAWRTIYVARMEVMTRPPGQGRGSQIEDNASEAVGAALSEPPSFAGGGTTCDVDEPREDDGTRLRILLCDTSAEFYSSVGDNKGKDRLLSVVVREVWRMWCKRLDMIRRGDAPGIPPPSVP